MSLDWLEREDSYRMQKENKVVGASGRKQLPPLWSDHWGVRAGMPVES